MEFLIRPAQPNDFPAVIALTEVWATEGSTTGHYANNTDEWLRQCLGPFFLVAEGDGEVLGFLLGVLDGDRHNRMNYQVVRSNETLLSLNQLYVREDCRNQGIGAALVQLFREQADAQGVTQIALLSMNQDWPRTIRFYERCGFRRWYFTMFSGHSTTER